MQVICISYFTLSRRPCQRETAEKKQLVNKNSARTYILSDSSKSGRNTLCKVLDLEEATIICEKVTDVVEACGDYIIAE